jgi:hydrogenase small subunit
MAEGLAKARRQAVIWLSFQECTGCTESLTRAFSPTLEDLIFNFISLDYHHTLMAVSGEAAENARLQSIAENKGKYIVIVDGSVPTKNGGVYSTIAGRSNLDTLRETAKDAFAIISVGTCAAFGGLPHADPNPTGAVAIDEIIKDKPIVNIPGCPPIPEAMTGTVAHLLSFGKLPELDHLKRPKAFFGETIHDRCYRRPFYQRGLFAKAFDDEGARKGWCLYEVGCKGPVTYNACATLKWNGGVSFPIQSGHGCLGCSEPNFWDKGGFYRPLPAPLTAMSVPLAGAAAAGAIAGAGAATLARAQQLNSKSGTKKTEEA